MLVLSPYLLEVRWDEPYSHPDYPVQGYAIQILNMTSGKILEYSLGQNETSYRLTTDDHSHLMHYCHRLIVRVAAESELGQSVPGNVSGGFPIGMNNPRSP